MRYVEILKENDGMLAIKQHISDMLEEYPNDEDYLQEWSIFDDLVITDDGGLILYRSLDLKNPWEENLKLSGHLYWSTSFGGAQSYNTSHAKNTVTVILVVELPANKIDFGTWQKILEFHDFGEDELRFESGTHLKIIDVYVDGKHRSDSKIIGTILTT